VKRALVQEWGIAFWATSATERALRATQFRDKLRVGSKLKNTLENVFTRCEYSKIKNSASNHVLQNENILYSEKIKKP
jgi:hypothetical protein